MTEAEKRIACLGDSNTYGYDPASRFGSRYPPEIRWTGALKARGWLVFNRGMNGCTVPVCSQFPTITEMIGSLGPLDAVTVMLGTNDLLQGGTARETAARMAQFLSAVRESMGKATLILIAPPPVTFGDWVRDQAVIRESEKLAAYYREIADDRSAVFADAGQWGAALSFDGVHFTPEGHGAFFRGLNQLLEALFPTPPCLS